MSGGSVDLRFHDCSMLFLWVNGVDWIEIVRY
jgi:hypothetical protein